ncbi:hypothetical protein MTX20_00555 (plasmid) [Bradyrhizobium sp. ISRA435]|nr:hypothetical protein MTX20_00555 [Bradyrhizobium sp. ISRA435]
MKTRIECERFLNVPLLRAFRLGRVVDQIQAFTCRIETPGCRPPPIASALDVRGLALAAFRASDADDSRGLAAARVHQIDDVMELLQAGGSTKEGMWERAGDAAARGDGNQDGEEQHALHESLDRSVDHGHADLPSSAGMDQSGLPAARRAMSNGKRTSTARISCSRRRRLIGGDGEGAELLALALGYLEGLLDQPANRFEPGWK